MDPFPASNSTVSNLVPVWDVAPDDGGGSYEPAEAAVVVEQAIHAEETRETRLVTPPERFDAAEPIAQPSAFSYELLVDQDDTWNHGRDIERDDVGPIVDYDALRRRDIAKELLRDRLVSIAEQRERRSAYEIVFIMLAAAVAVLLAAPPLVQVLLAAHGTRV